MNEQICTKCNAPKSILDFPKGRRQCCSCWRKYQNKWNLDSGRTKNTDGTKRKHIPKYDLVGQRFGRLTAIKFIGIYSKIEGASRLSMFRCKCECKNELDVAGVYLKNGNVKSCGCLVHDTSRKNHTGWSGYRGLSGTSWNKIVRNGSKSVRSKRRKMEFTITQEYVWALFEKQGGKCAISGIDILLDIGSNIKLQTASLDRIDSSKGYIEGNVQWVHKDVNTMKMDFSEDYFLEMCNRIVENKKFR